MGPSVTTASIFEHFCYSHVYRLECALTVRTFRRTNCLFFPPRAELRWGAPTACTFPREQSFRRERQLLALSPASRAPWRGQRWRARIRRGHGTYIHGYNEGGD